MAKVVVRCPFCEQTHPVKKHGFGKGGYQRYRCQSCKYTLQLDYAYRASEPGIGIGADLTISLLPHHRTYWSVYGGSVMLIAACLQF